MVGRQIHNFLPNPEAIRKDALAQDYTNLHSFEGEVYKRVCVRDIPGLTEAIEEVMGPVLMLGQGYRLNYGGELPNNQRHTDEGWGTHAVVYYLSKGGGGTAFWNKVDGDDAQMIGLCEEEFGKAVIYRSNQPHSRWPLEAYGDCPENGRLVAVAFFTPLEEL